jgi:hypothetical protein
LQGREPHRTAESHSRVRSWGTIAAFALIIAVNIGEGIDMGFYFWNWLLIAFGAAVIFKPCTACGRRRGEFR